MTIIRSPIELTVSREYVAARSRQTLLAAAVAMILMSAVWLAEKARGGAALAEPLAIAAVASVLIVAIVYFGVASLVRKWSIVLKPDDSIDIAGVSDRTIRASADEAIAIEKSSDGREWLVIGSKSRQTLHRFPVAAFPELQTAWQKVRLG